MEFSVRVAAGTDPSVVSFLEKLSLLFSKYLPSEPLSRFSLSLSPLLPFSLHGRHVKPKLDEFFFLPSFILYVLARDEPEKDGGLFSKPFLPSNFTKKSVHPTN